MVEHSTHNPKTEYLNTITGTEREKILNNFFVNLVNVLSVLGNHAYSRFSLKAINCTINIIDCAPVTVVEHSTYNNNLEYLNAITRKTEKIEFFWILVNELWVLGNQTILTF